MAQESQRDVSLEGSGRRFEFQLGWVKPGEKGFTGPAIDVYVPPGQSRVLAAPKPPAGGAGLNQLLLTGDEEDFDNRGFSVNAKPEEVKVLFLGSDPERDPEQSLYYLRRAFPETRQQIVQIVARPPGAPVEDLFNFPLLVVAGTPAGEGARAVRSFLELGKPVLFVLKSPAAAQSLAEILGLGTVTAEEAPSGGSTFELLGQIDFEHPLFSPFADPRFSDFTKIHFWKHRKVDPAQFKGAKVLAKFDRGDAAMIQIPVGKGILFLLTSGWQPADSQLALSSKFVPLLYSLLDLSGGVKAQLAHYTVGDSVTLPGTNAAQVFTVIKPDGAEVKVPAADRFTDTDLPGVYTVTGGGAPQQFAVNLDPSESRTAVLPVEELERLRLPLLVSNPEVIKKETEKRLRLQATELEQRQKIWRWLIVVALIILLLETWLAGWITRRSRSPEGAEPAVA